MMKYNNEAYKELINTIISDAFYVDGLSYDAKIAQIRRYTEIILRRILNYPSNQQLTVGDKEIKKRLKEAGYEEPIFNKSLKTIGLPGNKRTHTQVLEVAKKEDYEKVLDA